MMGYQNVYAIILMFVFCPCKGQNNTELPKHTIKSETKDVITSHGPSTSVRTIKQDRKGNIWLASNEGIIRYNGKSFTNITGDMSPNRFFSVLEDKNGNFWFGNNGSGVYYSDGKSFRNFTTTEGLADNRVMCMYEDSAGMIWFGTIGGVSRYDGKSFRNFTTEQGLCDNGITTIIEDRTGKIWIGTRGGACYYDGKTFTAVTNKDGMAFRDIWSIIEDKKGKIWIGGNNGLWRHDGSTFTRINGNAVSYVYEDKKGNIWTSGINANGKWALSRYDEKSLSHKKPTVIEITKSLNLFGILEANDGSIWFGSFDGVYRYDGNIITDFRDKQIKE